MNLNFYPRLIV